MILEDDMILDDGWDLPTAEKAEATVEEGPRLSYVVYSPEQISHLAPPSRKGWETADSFAAVAQLSTSAIALVALLGVVLGVTLFGALSSL